MTRQIPPAVPPSPAEPAQRFKPRHRLDRAAIARLLVIAGFVALAVGLLLLSRHRYKHSVTATCWGWYADIDFGDRWRRNQVVGIGVDLRRGILNYEADHASFAGDSFVIGFAGKPVWVCVPGSLESHEIHMVIDSPPGPRTLDVEHAGSGGFAVRGRGLKLYASATRLHVMSDRDADTGQTSRRFSLWGEHPPAVAGKDESWRDNTLYFLTDQVIRCGFGSARVRLGVGDSERVLAGPGGTLAVYARGFKKDEREISLSGKPGEPNLDFCCSRHDTVTIATLEPQTVTFYVDSGRAAIGSHLRPTPQEFKMPVTLRVVGDLRLRVTMVGTQLRFDLSGLAKSVRYIGGNDDDGPDVGRLGVELVPSAVESGRDTFLAVAGILVILTQLVKFLWDLFRK